jgi:hypothetical protein
MKKLLCLFALLAGWMASGQAFDFTYSTNLFYALPYTTNIFCGTNGSDPARDSYIVIWNKVNHNTTLLEAQVAADTNWVAENYQPLLGFQPATNGALATDGLLVSSNSWVQPFPTLAYGDNLYRSSNGVPHVIWRDQGGSIHTNRLVP